MKRSIFRRAILTLSLSAVLLGATAASASAFVTVTPSSTNFGDRQVGTTSPAQQFTLTAKCNVLSGINLCLILNQPFTYSPNISTTSGEFAQTNNCPPTLSTFSATTGASCLINVTFTPTSTGPKAATLNTGQPCTSCTAALTGNGVTTPTPPTPPTPGGQAAPPPLSLLLDAKKQQLKKTLKFSATTNHDAQLLASGPVKKTAVELVAGQKTTIKATLKKKARKSLANKIRSEAEGHQAKTTVQVSATDQAGATAIGKIQVKLTG